MGKRVGIIVDGEGDYAAIGARLGAVCKILKADGPRGHTVSPADLAQSSKKQINMLRFFGCRLVILMTDFEERPENYNDFVCALRREMEKLGPAIDVKIVVPNKMIENWYLADIRYLSTQKSYLRRLKSQKQYEGKHGKRELKKLFLNGTPYNEIRHGSELFALVRFEVAAGRSASLKCFLECLP